MTKKAKSHTKLIRKRVNRVLAELSAFDISDRQLNIKTYSSVESAKARHRRKMLEHPQKGHRITQTEE